MDKVFNILIFFFVAINSFFPIKVISEDKNKGTVSNREYKNEYILGVGDKVGIEVLEAKQYSGDYLIGPDSNIYIPSMKPISASGLTIKELEKKNK